MSRTPTSTYRRFFILLGGLALATCALGSYWVYDTWLLKSERRALNSLADSYAQRQADRLGDHLSRVAEVVATAARERAGDPVEPDALSAQLDSRLHGFHSLQLANPETAEVNRQEEPPMGFMELDMIKRVARGESAAPEARQVGEQWLVNVAAAMPAGESGPQVLLLRLNAEAFLKPLQGAGLNQGSTRLVQQFRRGERQIIASRGQGTADSGRAEVANSHWQVQFSPGEALVAGLRVAPEGLWWLPALFAVASLLGAHLLARRLAARTTAATPRGDGYEGRLDDTGDISELLGLSMESTASEPAGGDGQAAMPAEIFRSYDIRGLAQEQLTADNVSLIGRALGSEALAAGEDHLYLARDGRTHSARIRQQLVDGITATGCNVMDIGLLPSPVLYFACAEGGQSRSGVMITASHNPPEYNGFKVVIGGDTLRDRDLQSLYRRCVDRDFRRGQGQVVEEGDWAVRYIDCVLGDVALAGEAHIVVDAGNGATGELAPRLFETLGCKVTTLFCEVDGNFPNRPPDPSVAENLTALVDKVKSSGAHLGLALDGDGDRLSVVTGGGKVVSADQLMMLLAWDILARHPGADVVYDVKSSRALNQVIRSHGGRPTIWQSGHAQIKAGMKESTALLGGELSGHIFIGDRWYGFDDGLYAGARIVEIMNLRGADLDTLIAGFPKLLATPEIRVPVAEERKFALVEALREDGDFGDGTHTTIDGLRVDYDRGWGLVRASNTAPALTLRFEAEDEATLKALKQHFKKQLLKFEPSLSLDF